MVFCEFAAANADGDEQHEQAGDGDGGAGPERRGEAESGGDGQAADPGAERVADVEGGDVRARRPASARASAYVITRICSPGTVAKPKPPMSTSETIVMTWFGGEANTTSTTVRTSERAR